MGMLLRRHRQHQSDEEQTYDDKTVKELRDIAKDRDIEGYSEMKKSELIEALKS